VKGKPIVIATLEGNDADAPTILLNSHYDVVPVVEVIFSHYNIN
jgi:acetylornithine deacetylase/succinyl-diaminopimelate desuccinylase-like protein